MNLKKFGLLFVLFVVVGVVVFAADMPARGLYKTNGRDPAYMYIAIFGSAGDSEREIWLLDNRQVPKWKGKMYLHNSGGYTFTFNSSLFSVTNTDSASFDCNVGGFRNTYTYYYDL
jgi:hypothetical protein